MSHELFGSFSPNKLKQYLSQEFASSVKSGAGSEAETLYQKALQLIAELKQISKQEQGTLQAGTYHQLGIVAQEQREWEQAKQYYQHALELFVLYKDDFSSNTLFQLAQIWKATDDTNLPIAIASVMNMKPEEVEQLFRELLKNDDQ